MMLKLYAEHAAWAEEVIGPSSLKGPIGPLRHLIKEANEAIENPTDITEYVDCMFLVWDAARRAGFDWFDLKKAGFEKLAKIKTRTYKRDLSDNPVEHDRSKD